MLSETSFLLDPTTTSSRILMLSRLLLAIRISVERCTVQEKWCFVSRVYDIKIKSFAENDKEKSNALPDECFIPVGTESVLDMDQ